MGLLNPKKVPDEKLIYGVQKSIKAHNLCKHIPFILNVIIYSSLYKNNC